MAEQEDRVRLVVFSGADEKAFVSGSAIGTRRQRAVDDTGRQVGHARNSQTRCGFQRCALSKRDPRLL